MKTFGALYLQYLFYISQLSLSMLVENKETKLYSLLLLHFIVL